jgi:hypothetical protein
MSLAGSVAACTALALVVVVVRRRVRDGRLTLRVARPGTEPLSSRRHRGRSVIPDGARPEPGDEPCVGLGHTGLSWCEETQRVRRGVRRHRIVDAICGDCDRPQNQVRIVYPADYTIPVVRRDGQPTPSATT